jgi:hypothetical protein
MISHAHSILRALLVASIAFAGGNCFASPDVLFVGAGTPTTYRTLGLAAYNAANCGPNSWTQEQGAGQMGVDNRPNAPSISGDIWVIWATDSKGNITTICAFFAVDSVQAVRLYLAQPTGSVCLLTQQIGSPGANLLPHVTDVPLSQAAYNAINCQVLNAAFSELRAEDAKFDTAKWLLTPPPLGYGPGPIGTPVQGIDSSSLPIVGFAISGPDPITGVKAKNFSESDLGASPLVVFVNAQDTSSAGLGNPAFNNVDRFVLAATLNGTFTRTRDLWATSRLPCVGPHVFLPSPVSGPWAIMEYGIVDSKEVGSTQELDVQIPTDNPLNESDGPCGGSRQRLLGDGATVATVGATLDSIAYVAWRTSLLDRISTTAKYVKVDDVDPLFADYAKGSFPICGDPCPGLVTFQNVLDGAYPLWNVIRAVTANPVPPAVVTLIKSAQAQTSNYPDYVPSTSLLVFRSHYKQYVAPHNGHCDDTQAGGDVGGAVFTISGDEDFCTDTGLELTGMKQ